MRKESDIRYENGNYFVVSTNKNNFDIYKITSTHSEKCNFLDYPGDRGYVLAVREADRLKERDLKSVNLKVSNSTPFREKESL